MFHKYLKYKNKYLNIGGDKKEYFNEGVYNGDLKDGKRDGKGLMTYNKKDTYWDASTYDGFWKNDKKKW